MTLFFIESSEHNGAALKWMICDYCKDSGCGVNFSKSPCS